MSTSYLSFRPTTLAQAAALTLALTGGVHAQSLQLYGLVDAGVTHVTGLASGSLTQLSSGIMEGSRWGLKGTEDLGGGYKTIFTLENRFESDTGALSNRTASGNQLPDRVSSATALGLPALLNPVVQTINATSLSPTLGVNVANNYFDRQAYVGLITPVGAVVAGRQYTPGYEAFSNFDAMETQSALSAGQLVTIPQAFDIRYSNALQYRIELNGLAASVYYGLGESAGSSSNSRLLGAMAMYRTPHYGFGLGHNSRNNELGQKSLTTTTLGGWVHVGPGKLNALYSLHKDDNPTGFSTISATLTPLLGAPTAGLVQNAYVRAFRQDARLFNMGYRMNFGASTVTLSYSDLNDKTLADADIRSYGVAYTYALSKRTDLNAVLARFDNSAKGQTAPGGNDYIGGVTRAAGVDSSSLALGIRHRF